MLNKEQLRNRLLGICWAIVIEQFEAVRKHTISFSSTSFPVFEEGGEGERERERAGILWTEMEKSRSTKNHNMKLVFIDSINF